MIVSKIRRLIEYTWKSVVYLPSPLICDLSHHALWSGSLRQHTQVPIKRQRRSWPTDKCPQLWCRRLWAWRRSLQWWWWTWWAPLWCLQEMTVKHEWNTIVVTLYLHLELLTSRITGCEILHPFKHSAKQSHWFLHLIHLMRLEQEQLAGRSRRTPMTAWPSEWQESTSEAGRRRYDDAEWSWCKDDCTNLQEIWIENKY